MSKNFVELVFILDMSGSMSGLIDDTIRLSASRKKSPAKHLSQRWCSIHRQKLYTTG